MDFFANLDALAGMFVIDIAMGGNAAGGVERVPTLMSITQGDPRYASTLKSTVTGDVPNAASAARRLMRHLSNLTWRWKGDPEAPAEGDAERGAKLLVLERLAGVESELKGRLRAQAEAVVANAEASNEHLYNPGDPFRLPNFDDDEDVSEEVRAARLAQAEAAVNAQVSEFMSRQAALWARVVPKAMGVLQSALRKVDAAECLKKTEECVGRLELSQHFDLNKPPLSFRDRPGLMAYLGFEGTYADKSAVESAWELHCDNWRKPDPVMPPAEVYATWERMEVDAELAPLAMHAKKMWSCPPQLCRV